MRKVVLSEYLSLDGVMENPAWTAPYWSDEIAAFKYAELFESDALLLGRVTYEGFASAWPSMTDEQGFADRMNNLPKFVATRTLDQLTWNAQPIKEPVVDTIAALKQQPGENILIYGSGDLAQTLIAHQLIDEYRLMIYPVVLGSGQRLFRDATTLQLAETKAFGSGVVLMTYHPGSPA
jgi:dihydrofolate reductase